MTPEEMQIATLMTVGLFWTIAAIALGYHTGWIDGKADRKLWSKQEYENKARSN